MPQYGSHEDVVVDAAIALEAMTDEELTITVGPPKLPPRFGYGDRSERVPTIGTVIGVTRFYPDRRVDVSGVAGGNLPGNSGAGPY